MRLYTFRINGQTRIGAELNGQLVDLQPAYAALAAVNRSKAAGLQLWPLDMLSFMRLGEPALSTARDTLAWFKSLPKERQEKLQAGLTKEREAEVLADLKARKP